MKFLTLVETDLRKIIPFLIGIFVIATVGFQTFFFKIINNIHSNLVKDAAESGKSMSEYVSGLTPFSMSTILDENPLPILFMVLIALILILSGFYLWYKEWFGATKRIYLLLSIKGSRLRIYFSKLLVFLFVFFTFYGIVLLNLYIGTLVMKTILPAEAIDGQLIKTTLIHSEIITFLLPVSIGTLLYKASFLIMMFCMLSVFVLWDRSKRIWGLIGGLVFIVASIVLFFYMNSLYLYTTESIQLNWAFTLVFLVGSFLAGFYLLKKKVSI
ncbi:hypothetical protein [Bacillus sp. 1P06AnD]|uniref:hypothetical protein n=1 Tax=Bacillus sp. 1P06AnD TaxID=3132208 RepID=UPI0039A1952F